MVGEAGVLVSTVPIFGAEILCEFVLAGVVAGAVDKLAFLLRKHPILLRKHLFGVVTKTPLVGPRCPSEVGGYLQVEFQEEWTI